jgi:Helicase C-terminal domain
MAIDFNKIGQANAVDSALDPQTIFAALARNPRYTYLRNVQGEVLTTWTKRKNERDLVLKMNTGAGKTVVGLLMLKASINEGLGPAAYVTPDHYLADQVAHEADALGLAVTREPDNRYLSGKAILVDVTQSIINGKSVFGINRQTPLTSVFVDDAHSCIRTAEQQFTLTLPAKHAAYDELLKILKSSLEQQSSITFLEITHGQPTRPLLVPYWTWNDKFQQIAEVLVSHALTAEFEWPWPLVKDALKSCSCILTAKEITISSRCLNIGKISSFHSAKRRIFATATLADDSSLVTHFAANAKSVSQPITPNLAADIGERMIVAPQQLTPSITETEVKDFLQPIARTYNVVVIVPSQKRAQYWSDCAQLILNKDNIREGVRKLNAGHVGLTVLVNRYDGIDLPGDACRLLVVDGLPEIDRAIDQIDEMVLASSDFALARHIQRIEQGMGRGIRSNDDHCVVLLLGSRLIQRLSNPSAMQHFSPATRAQMALSDRVTDQLQGKSLDEMWQEAMRECLHRNPDWIRQSRGATAALTYPHKEVSPWAGDVRSAYDKSLIERFSDAEAFLGTAVHRESDANVKAWLMQQRAEYLHATDPVGAQQIQLDAQKICAKVLKPIQGIEYVKLSPQTNSQGEALAALLKVQYLSAPAMVIGFNAILEDLCFGPNSHERFEEAIKSLGFHLGFASHRPEREFTGGGPDNLWAVGGAKFIVIECKNEAISEIISKEYTDKSSGRNHWFENTYGPQCTYWSVMIHPSKVVSNATAADPKLRIVTDVELSRLKTAVRNFATTIAKNGFGSANSIAESLKYHRLTAENIIDTYTVPFTTQQRRHRK